MEGLSSEQQLIFAKKWQKWQIKHMDMLFEEAVMVVLSEKEIRGIKIRRLIYAADAGELVLIKFLTALQI